MPPFAFFAQDEGYNDKVEAPSQNSPFHEEESRSVECTESLMFIIGRSCDRGFSSVIIFADNGYADKMEAPSQKSPFDEEERQSVECTESLMLIIGGSCDGGFSSVVNFADPSRNDGLPSMGDSCDLPLPTGKPSIGR